MARLIDADALHFSYVEETSAPGWMHCVVRSLEIKEAPTIDAVPVVRCKDCKYYEETDDRIGTCLLTESGAEVDGFCAWAERKEEE